MVPLAAIATVAVQFSFVGVTQAQLTGGGLTGTSGGATTTTGGATTGGVAPTPIPVQPRFTG